MPFRQVHFFAEHSHAPVANETADNRGGSAKTIAINLYHTFTEILLEGSCF